MRSTPVILTNSHRIARLTAWLMLWLRGFVAAWCGWLGEGGALGRRRELDAMARTVCAIVVFNAATRVRPPRRRHFHRHGRLTRATRRARIGARLRHAAQGRDFASRLHAILSLVRDIERHIAAAMRRLRTGLTRLRVIDPLREDAPPHATALLSAVACADTS